MSHDTQDQVQETEVKIETQPQATRTFQGQESWREAMKALSKEIFGSESRYKKLFEYDHVLTQKVKETVPGENGQPDTEREVEVPIYAKGTKNVKQSVRKYRSVEEVFQLLLDFKAKRDAFIAQMKQQQEEAKAKAEQDAKLRKVQDELAGSAK
jgi:hypothetical protein